MYSDELIERFGGKLVDIENTSKYDRFSLELFTNKEVINNHRMEITLQFDITHAVNNFEQNIKKKFSNASLTAFLTWSLLQSINQHKHFNYRYIMNKWYHFSNLPLFMTVATGHANRISDEVIENVNSLNFEDFLSIFKQKIQDAYRDIAAYCTPEMWGIYHFIGNLPNLQFTALSSQTIHNDQHRPKFSFGKRYTADNRVLMPFAIHASHANVDPVLINNLLCTFTEITNEVP